jgi:CheY-like chemotaxis protein
VVEEDVVTATEEERTPVAAILLIDDDARVRGAVRDMLVALGHSVVEAGDGRVDLGSIAPVDLVIADVFMPERDGFEVLRRLRETRPALPVLMITGDPQFCGMDVATVARRLGARGVLAKPINVADLAAAVESALAGR